MRCVQLSNTGSRRSALTLIECVVVLAIIAVLIGLLLPAIQKVRTAAEAVKCRNNLHQLGLALHHFEGAHGYFPSRGLAEWSVQILPFLEQDALFRQYNPTLLPFQDPNATIGQQRLAVYLCPSDPAPASAGSMGWCVGSYHHNPNLLGISITEITDGSSQTAHCSELTREVGIGWILGPAAPLARSWNHTTCFHVLMADGSGRSLSVNLDIWVIEALQTPRGGEVLASDSF